MPGRRISNSHSSQKVFLGPGNRIKDITRQTFAVKLLKKGLQIRAAGEDLPAVLRPGNPLTLKRRKFLRGLFIAATDQFVSVHVLDRITSCLAVASAAETWLACTPGSQVLPLPA